MDNEITIRDTKSVILDAYNDILKQLKDEKKRNLKLEKARKEESKILKNVSKSSEEHIVNDIAQVKIEIAKGLDKVEEMRLEEFKKLQDIQKAIEIEKKNIEEIHQIASNADSLSALILAQEDRRNKFEAEMKEKKDSFNEEMKNKQDKFEMDMAGKRAQWKKESEKAEEELLDRKVRIEKDRQQEEEEYAYNLNKKRTQEKDDYENRRNQLEKEIIEKREQFEKEFSLREQRLKEGEGEFKEALQKVNNFPKEMEKAIHETEKKITDKLSMQFKYEKDVLAKEVEGERKLHKQIIASLESKIQEKDITIRQLTEKTDESSRQVQNIAVKAIDGATKVRIIREEPAKHSEKVPN